MADIGRLNVTLTASSGAFTSAMTQASRAASQMSDAVAGAVGRAEKSAGRDIKLNIYAQANQSSITRAQQHVRSGVGSTLAAAAIGSGIASSAGSSAMARSTGAAITKLDRTLDSKLSPAVKSFSDSAKRLTSSRGSSSRIQQHSAIDTAINQVTGMQTGLTATQAQDAQKKRMRKWRGHINPATGQPDPAIDDMTARSMEFNKLFIPPIPATVPAVPFPAYPGKNVPIGKLPRKGGKFGKALPPLPETLDPIPDTIAQQWFGVPPLPKSINPFDQHAQNTSLGLSGADKDKMLSDTLFKPGPDLIGDLLDGVLQPYIDNPPEIPIGADTTTAQQQVEEYARKMQGLRNFDLKTIEPTAQLAPIQELNSLPGYGKIKPLNEANVAAKNSADTLAKMRESIGGGKLVQEIGTVPKAVSDNAKQMADTLKRQYPEMAAEAAKQGKALVKVTQSGAMQVATRDARGKIGYRGAEGVAGEAASQGLDQATEAAKTAKKMNALAGKSGWKSAATAWGSEIGKTVGKGISRGLELTAKSVIWTAKKTFSLISSVASTAFKWTTVLGGLAGVGGIAGMVSIFRSGVKDIEDFDLQSRRLGISIVDLRSAMLLGGAASQSMIAAIDELGTKSGLLTRGNTETVRTFQALGALSGQRFGMTAGQVGGMDTVDQFDAIANRIARIKDPMAQASMASRMFGKAWVDILPILQQGGNALGEAREQARRFGLAVTPQDVENVANASRAMRNLGSIWEGLKTQFTLGIAPIASELAKGFDLSSINLEGFKVTIVGIFETVAKGAAFVIDSFSNVKQIQSAWEVMFDLIIGYAKVGFGKILSELGRKLKGTAIDHGGQMLLLEGLGNMWQGTGGLQIEKAKLKGKQTWDDAKNGQAMQKVNKFFDDVNKRVNQPGKPVLNGVNPALVNQLDQARGQMVQGIETPLEKFGQQMRDLQLMQGAGMFAGDPTMLARLQAKGFQDLAQGVTTDASGVKLAGAAEKYSREAYSSIVRAESGQIKNTVPEVLKQIAEQEKAQREAQLELTRQLLDALKNQPLPEVAKI